MNDIILKITDITDENKKEKFQKAIDSLSSVLNVPVTIKPKNKTGKEEEFFYQSQEDLIERWIKYFGLMIDEVYLGFCKYLDLPVVTTFSKSIESEMASEKPLVIKGKVVFNPENGKPLTTKDFNKLVQSIEKFLNRKIKDKEKSIVLDNAALGRLLGRMSGVNAAEAVSKLGIGDIKYRGYNFEDVSSDVKTYKDIFNPTDEELNMYKINQEIVGEKIQGIKEDTLKRLKETYWNGIKSRKSKSQISQDLFDSFGNLNKDVRKIVETESVDMQNASIISEEVANTEEGEKVYFKRLEINDGVTCGHCKKIKGTIALWYPGPLSSENINDSIAKIAIWPGKTNYGRRQADWWVAEGSQHPHCFSKDTEVLTNNGWKYFYDVLSDDKIMSINPDNKEVGYVSHKGLIQYHYEGDMVKFNGRNYDQLVTPEHNCLYVSKKTGKLLQKKAKDMLNKDISLPRGVGIWKGNDDDLIKLSEKANLSIDIFTKLWGWFLSEGNIRSRNGGREVKLSQKYPVNIVNDIGNDERFHVYKDSICIYDKYITECFIDFFGIHAEKKYIPSFIREASPKYIKMFLNSFRLGDGSKIKRDSRGVYGSSIETIIRTSSPKMAADLCELIIKAGMFCSIYKQDQKGKTIKFENGDYILNTDCYMITILKSKTRKYFKDIKISKSTGLESKRIELEKYSDMVYDVELEKWHFMLVRRNGKLAWSGNCRGSWTRYYPDRKDKKVPETVKEYASQKRIAAEKKVDLWSQAMKQAEDEWRDKGVDMDKNYNRTDPEFLDRIKEIFEDLQNE